MEDGQSYCTIDIMNNVLTSIEDGTIMKIDLENPNHEYWIGLRNIHCLTLHDNVDLRTDL